MLYTGFQRGTHTRWQLVANDGTGAQTIADMWGEFWHREGWDADPVHRGSAERILCRGAGDRRGVGRGLQAGDHSGFDSHHAVHVILAVHEQWGKSSRGSVRMFGGKCRARQLIPR